MIPSTWDYIVYGEGHNVDAGFGVCIEHACVIGSSNLPNMDQKLTELNSIDDHWLTSVVYMHTVETPGTNAGQGTIASFIGLSP
jgi:hypothetical protein